MRVEVPAGLLHWESAAEQTRVHSKLTNISHSDVTDATLKAEKSNSVEHVTMDALRTYLTIIVILVTLFFLVTVH